MPDYTEANDRADIIWDLKAQLKDAQDRIAAMTLARDPATMNEVALEAAIEIEDIFAKGFERQQFDGVWISAVQFRRNVIKGAIQRVIGKSIAGAS